MTAAIKIFLPFRRDKLDAPPEAVLGWLMSQIPQHDGRCYIRTSRMKAEFGNSARVFYQIMSDLACYGLVDVERWRLEAFNPGRPRHGFRLAGEGEWGHRETLYAFTPVPPDVVITFETYVTPVDAFPALHKELREVLWLEADRRCAYCGVEVAVDTFQIDHKVPKSRGGRHRWDNLAVSCHACNSSKSASTPEEFAIARGRA